MRTPTLKPKTSAAIRPVTTINFQYPNKVNQKLSGMATSPAGNLPAI
jgi:hypothetical protein